MDWLRESEELCVASKGISTFDSKPINFATTPGVEKVVALVVASVFLCLEFNSWSLPLSIESSSLIWSEGCVGRPLEQRILRKMAVRHPAVVALLELHKVGSKKRVDEDDGDDEWGDVKSFMMSDLVVNKEKQPKRWERRKRKKVELGYLFLDSQTFQREKAMGGILSRIWNFLLYQR